MKRRALECHLREHGAGHRRGSNQAKCAVSPPYLVATKLEAFAGRGRGDLLGSRDLADVLSLVDARAEVVGECAAAPQDVRRYLAAELGRLLEQPRFLEAVFGSQPPDAGSQDRVEAIVLPRLQAPAAGL